jgi:hypothetical protein
MHAKTLVKSTPGVKFHQHFMKPFCKKIFAHVSLVRVWLCGFWRKDIEAKAACKMLMKLTTVYSSKRFSLLLCRQRLQTRFASNRCQKIRICLIALQIIKHEHKRA